MSPIDPTRLARAMAIASGASLKGMGPHWQPLAVRVVAEYERLEGADGYSQPDVTKPLHDTIEETP